MSELLGLIRQGLEFADLLIVAILGYMFLYKGPLSVLWWPIVAPVLEPLGFRLVCMDRSFQLYSVRYVGRENA